MKHTLFVAGLIAATMPGLAYAQAPLSNDAKALHNDIVTYGKANGAKLDQLHTDLQAILDALKSGATVSAGAGATTGATAGATAGATTGTPAASATDAVTAKFFTADPGLAAFPSPENSRMLRSATGISGRPYLLDSAGVVHQLVPVTPAVPNGYTVNGNWAQGGGSDHSPVPQLIVRQGKVFAQAAGGPWQFYNPSGGSLYNASLPDAFSTDASGNTTSTVATSSVKAPAAAARQSPAPGTSGKVLKVCASGCAYTAISPAIAAAAAGDTVDIGPGTYKETPPAWTVPLKIVFETGASLDTTGLKTLARGKGALVPAADSVIVNPVITGAGMTETSAGGTAAIRPDLGAGYLDIQGGVLTGNQNGVASGDVPVVVTITDTHFDNNGLGDGYTHNMYLSNGTLSLTLTNVISTNPNNGHAVKSRAYATTIKGGSFDAFSAAVIDIPQGSVDPALIDGATITKKPGAYNHTVLDYATENTNSGNGGLILRNTTLNLLCDNPAIMVGGGSVVTLDTGMTMTGTKPVAQGGTVKGL